MPKLITSKQLADIMLSQADARLGPPLFVPQKELFLLKMLAEAQEDLRKQRALEYLISILERQPTAISNLARCAFENGYIQCIADNQASAFGPPKRIPAEKPSFWRRFLVLIHVGETP